MMYLGYGVGIGFLAIIFNVLWYVLIITLIVAIIRHVRASETENKAIDILRARYARGAIDKKEFEEKKKGLEAIV